MSDAYVVCGYKSWNREVFDTTLSHLPGHWYFIGSQEELTLEFLKKVAPQYIFFLHWSWIVPRDILEAYECVNFHMTDLPYGRGGSPLQNLILRGHTKTKLTAHRMTKEVDEGPIYLKEDLRLDGTAEEILKRASDLSIQMVQYIIEQNPKPTPQRGKVVLFKRRTPEQSKIPEGLSAKERYDFIRMLDAEGYPHAFSIENGVCIEYHNATLVDGRLEADATPVPNADSYFDSTQHK